MLCIKWASDYANLTSLKSNKHELQIWPAKRNQKGVLGEKGKNLLEAEERAVKVMRGGEERGDREWKGKGGWVQGIEIGFRAREMGATLGFSRRGT